MIKKSLFIALLMAIPFFANAQDNTWEQPEPSAEAAKENPDQKYLAGAVPLVDGKVVFETTIKAPGKTRKQLFNTVLAYFEKLVKEPNQFEQSRILFADTVENKQLAANLQEWLVFKNKPLVLDRTRLLYQLSAECEDGEVRLKMNRIVYFYDEEREPQTYLAEEWITDKIGLNKKQTKLARVSGKFRRKTIDRKDYLFGKIEQLCKEAR